MCRSQPSPPQITYVPFYIPAPTPARDPWKDGYPQSGNDVINSMRTPNNGLATIESVTQTQATSNAPALQDPMGEGSQRVQRQKAKLAIAQ